MKKLLLPILFLLLVLPAMSQTLVAIHGTVTDTLTGNPVPNHAVTIMSDSSGGWFYYRTVFTNNSGFYVDTIPVPQSSTGILFVSTLDCQNYPHMVTLTFNPVNINFTVNFAICYYNVPCAAGFTYQQMQSLAVQFTDASVGGENIRLWTFGDGGTSTLLNPVHQYSQPGHYYVTLTIGALGTTCYNSITQNIYVWDSVGGGCQADFMVVPDTMNALYLYHFIDQSIGNIVSWYWNFGDPASGMNNTSTLQNPVHAYSTPGTYTACLTIHGADSLCYDMTCETFVVGNGGGGCQAQFTYYADTASSANTIHFIDQSTTGPNQYITTWTWSFGDGHTQTVSFPANPNVTHTYLTQGTFTVCLTIQGNDPTCADFTCQTVVVGSPSNCHAAFTYYADTSNSATTIHFIDQSTGNITYWNWSFGDGTFSIEQNPVHTYAGPGYYLVTLGVGSPNQWCYDVTSDTIVVGTNPGCQANFTYSTGPNLGSHTVQFTDLSTGLPSSWSWSFGDGTGSNVQNPVHTYGGPGTYSVCLTIAGNNCTSTFCQDVVINDSSTYRQVYGQVFAGNFPLSSGLAMIFSLDTNAIFQPFIDVFPIDSNGVYYFSMVPPGSYYILVIPFTPTGYLPTYYGNTISWQQATLITLGTPNNPYNISLVAGSLTNGPGSTSGQINMGGLKSTLLDKVNMILLNDQMQPLGFTAVSTSGAFGFPALAYGTYYLHAEMPGVTSDYVRIDLTAEKPHADVVMTFMGNKILGLHDETSMVSSWNVYPNPVNDICTISLNMKHGTQAEVAIFNLSGQVVTRSNVALNNGENKIGISTTQLSAGIYTLRITSGDGVNVITKLVKTR